MNGLDLLVEFIDDVGLVVCPLERLPGPDHSAIHLNLYSVPHTPLKGLLYL
jgi:hypothetical protein